MSAQKHLDWFNDFIDLEEVYFEDVKMRLFTQSLVGEVIKWFRALPAASIINFEAFETSFLAQWDENKNPQDNLQGNLKIIYLLQVSPRNIVLQRMHWRNKIERGSPKEGPRDKKRCSHQRGREKLVSF
jgi:hypothetical protein